MSKNKNTQSFEYPIIPFVSTTGKHNIKIEIDVSRKQALINTMNIDPQSPVELALLLKKITEELKKIYINYIIQQISKEDWDNNLKHHGLFKYVNYNEKYNYVNIMCTLDEFPKAVMTALGFEN